MPNLGNYEKVITYKIEADASNANKVIDALQNSAAKNPIKVNVEIDEKTIKEQLGRIIGALSSVTDKGQLKVGGIDKLENALVGINNAIKEIQNTMRKKTPFQLESEISEAEGVLKSYQARIRDTYKSLYGKNPRAIKNGNIQNISGIMDQLKPHNDLLNKSAQEFGADLMGNDFDKVIKKIAQVAVSGQDLYKITTKIGHDEYNYIDMWHNLMSKMKGIREGFGYKTLGSFLSNAGISEETRNLVNYISQVVRAQSSLKSLRQEKEILDNTSPAGVKVQIDTESINALSEAISGIKAVIGDDENIKIGFNSEDVQKITDAFSELKNILVVIKDSIVSFSVPIKTQDISKLKEEISYFKQLDDAINNYKAALGKNSPNANAAFSNITNLINTRTGKQFTDDDLSPVKDYINLNKSSGDIFGFLNDSYGLKLSKSILSMTTESTNSTIVLDGFQAALKNLTGSIDKMSAEVTGAISRIKAVNVSFAASKLNNEQVKLLKTNALQQMDDAVYDILARLNHQSDAPFVASDPYSLAHRLLNYEKGTVLSGTENKDALEKSFKNTPELFDILIGGGTLDNRLSGMQNVISLLLDNAKDAGYDISTLDSSRAKFDDALKSMHEQLGIGKQPRDPLSQSLSSAFANALQENTSFSELATSISSFTEQLSGLITGLSTVNTTLGNLATEIATQNKTIVAGNKPIKLTADSAVIGSAVLSEDKDNQAAIATQKEVVAVTKTADTTGIDEQNEKLALDTELAKKDIIVKKEVMKVTSTADTSGIEKQNEVVQESIDLSKKDIHAKKELAAIEDDTLKSPTSNASLAEKGIKAKGDALNATANADTSGIEKQNEALQKDIKLAEESTQAKKETMLATAESDTSGINKQNQELKETADYIDDIQEKDSNLFRNTSYYLTQRGIVGNDSWTTKEATGFAQTLSSTFEINNQGQVELVSESLYTDFGKLSNLIYQNDKAIITLAADINRLNKEGIDTTDLQDNLQLLKQARTLMDQEMDRYFNEQKYAPYYSSTQEQTFRADRAARIRYLANQETQKNTAAGTRAQNKDAIVNYKSELRDSAKYYELRIRQQQQIITLSQDEADLLNEIEQRRNRAFNGLGEFAGTSQDVVTARNNLVTQDQDVAKSRVHADLNTKTMRLEGMLRNDTLDPAYEIRLNNILQLINKINSNPLDLTNQQTLTDLANINDEYVNILQEQNAHTDRDAASQYKSLLNDSKKYWNLRIKALRQTKDNNGALVPIISSQELADLNDLEIRRNLAIRGAGVYSGTGRNVTNARMRFFNDDTTGITDSLLKGLSSKESFISNLQNTGGWTTNFDNRLTHILTLIRQINQNPLDLVDQNTLQLLAQIEDEYSDILNTKNSKASKSGTNAIQDLQKDFETFLSNNSAAIASPRFHRTIEELRRDIEDAIPGNALDRADELRRRVSALQAAIAERRNGGNSFLTSFSKALKSANTQFLIRFFSLQDMIRYGRQIFTYVQQLDSALTELRIVSNATASDLNRVSKEAYNIANELGSTTTEIVQSITSWRRLGKSIEDSMVLAEQAAKLSTGGIMDTATATEALTSAMQAFNYSAKDVSDVVDQFIYLGNNYAITSEELATSLENSSAALVAAGNSLEEAEAIVVAGNTVMQDASSVSNAAKVISMRLRGTTASELENAGEDTEGLIENASKLYSTIKNLTKVAGSDGISIIDANGDYKSTYQILLEIAEVWDELSDVNQAALLETIAGKVRGAAAAAILQNPEVLESAFNSASNDAEGAGTKALEASMDSIEKRIAVIKNEWQGIWQQTLKSNTVKAILKFVEKLLSGVGKLVKAVGPAGVIGAVIGATQGFKNIDKLPAIIRSITTMYQVSRQEGATRLAAGFNALNAELLGTLPAILGVAGAIAALVAIYKVWDHFNITHQEALDVFEDASANVEKYKSEIESLNDELNETRNRIDELNKLPSLTLIEQSELENLKETNRELERQLDTTQKLEEYAKKSAAAAATEAAFMNQDADGFIEDLFFNENNWVLDKLNGEVVNKRTGERREVTTDLSLLQGYANLTKQNNDEINQKKRQQAFTSDVEKIRTLQEEINALEKENATISIEAADLIERSKGHIEAWKESPDNANLEYVSWFEDAIRMLAQVDMTDSEKHLDNIKNLLADKNIMSYLEAVVDSSTTAAEAVKELGINLEDLDIPEEDFNKYFSDLVDNVDDANIKLIEFAGSVGEVDSASESANSSAQWDKMAEHAAAVKELYEAGKTGTDDFQSFVEFISPGSFSTPENINATEFDSQAYQKEYEKLKKKIERYFTPDDTSTDDVNEATTSMNNLLADLTKADLATYADGVYHWTDAFKSTDDAAKALGIDVKATEVLLHSLEDYGFEFQDVLWSGETLSSFKDKVEQIKEAGDALKETGADEGFLSMLDNMAEGWNNEIQQFENDLSGLTEGRTIQLDFIYDLTQLQQDITTAQTTANLYGGQDIQANAGLLSSYQNYIREAMTGLGLDQDGIVMPANIQRYIESLSEATNKFFNTDYTDEKAYAAAQRNALQYASGLKEALDDLAEEGIYFDPEMDLSDLQKQLDNAFDPNDSINEILNNNLNTVDFTLFGSIDQTALQTALSQLPEDTTISFTADVEGVEQEVYSILDAEGNVVYFANVDGVLTALNPLRNQDGTFTYYANTNPATTAVNAMQRYANGLGANIAIGADLTKFNQAMAQVQTNIAKLGSNVGASTVSGLINSGITTALNNFRVTTGGGGTVGGGYNSNGNGGDGINDRSSGSGSGSGSGGGGGGGDEQSPAEKLKDEFDDLYDWIEVWIKRVDESIEKWETQAELYTSTMSNKKSLASQLKRFNEAQKLAEKSAARTSASAAAYLKTANSVGLSDAYKKLVQNGDWDKIQKIDPDGLLRAQIDLYTEWYEKYLNAKNQQLQWEQKTVELEQSKLDAIQSHYEALRANYETTIDNIESVISRREAAGFTGTSKQYKKTQSFEKKIVNNLTKERDKLLKELQNGGLKRGSDAYNQKLAEIRAINQEINEHSANIYEATKSIQQLTIESNETNKELKQAIVDRLEAVATLTETHGNRVNDNIYVKEIKGIMGENANILNINNALFKQIKDNFSENGMWAKEGGKALNEKQLEKVYEYILKGNFSGLQKYLSGLGYTFSQMTGLKDIMSQIYENQEEYLSNANSIEELVDQLQESRTKQLQDMIDSIEDVHEAAEKALELQKAQFDYQKALNNKTVRTWNGNEWVYTADVEAIKSAQETLDNLNYQALIDGLNKAIEGLEKLATDTNIYEDDGTLRENWYEIIQNYRKAMNDVARTWKKTVLNAGYTVDISAKSDATDISAQINTTAAKFATGGVISSKGKNDDTLILVSDKERVLTARQNAAFEKMVEASLNPNKNLMITPPVIDAVRSQTSSIFQTFNVSLPNINDSSTAMQLMKELQNLSTKKIQYFNQ